MLREIAALRTLAGTTVPHPGFIAGCDDLDVLGVVFYLMEEVDGFNPGNDMSEAYVRDASMRHQVGLSYAASLAQLGNVAWEGSPLAELKRPGSFLERQVPQFLAAARKLSARPLRPRIAGGHRTRGVAGSPTGRPTASRESCMATRI